MCPRQNEPLTIEVLVDLRWSKEHNDYLVLVKWDGLEEMENSWEPMKNLLKDVPLLLEAYCQDKSQDVKAYLSKLKSATKVAEVAKATSKRGRASPLRTSRRKRKKRSTQHNCVMLITWEAMCRIVKSLRFEIAIMVWWGL